MNTRIHEDTRAFREFYPEAAMRHQVHYAFAHQFLPPYVQQNPYAFFTYLFRSDMPGGAMEPTRFIQSRWTMFEENAGLVKRESDPFKHGLVFRRVLDLTMSIHELGGRAGALIRMPVPEQALEAFFVGVVLLAPAAQAATWPRDVQARVFTLEAEFGAPSVAGPTGLVCEWTRGGEHLNSGFGVRAEPDAFLRAVATVLEAPKAPLVAGFTPPKEGASPDITPAV
jgi:hypothetical protein